MIREPGDLLRTKERAAGRGDPGADRLSTPEREHPYIGLFRAVLEFRVTSDAPTRILVCTTCRTEGEPGLPMEDRSGARLFRALAQAVETDPSLQLVPVECLSVCKRPCTVGLSAPGKWTYVYGDMPPDTAVSTILDAARLYAATPDGLIPWKLRVDAIKKGVVARLPPFPPPQNEDRS